MQNYQYKVYQGITKILLSIKDGYTAQHAHDVAELAKKIGEILCFEEAIIRDLWLAGWLHDIGKVMIPKRILAKPGPLNLEERALINAHPAIGAKLTRQIGGSDRIVRAILTHHERLDGSGYPNRLRRDQLDFFSQVIAVADVYDAMLSDRPYRKTLSKVIALDHLSNPNQFNETVFWALKKVVDGSV